MLFFKKISLIFVSVLILPFYSCTTSRSASNNTDKYAYYPPEDETLDEVEETSELSADGGEITDAEYELEAKIASEDFVGSEKRSAEEILADKQSRITFPLVYNPMVAKWIDYFQGTGRKHFVKWLGRATRYEPIMKEAITKYQLPQELMYLSMIESGFNNRAYSSAHAVGMWQFIRSTGRAYGLNINSWVDERRDPEKSAEAAARYLRDLYLEFDNWYLAVAAYNAGSGKMRNAIKMYGTSNFWELTRSSKKYLKPETKNYVPKIIAASLIARNLKHYGFSEAEIRHQTPLEYDVYKVSVPIDLYQVAKLTGSPVSHIKDLNPELRRNIVPPGSKDYELRIPKGKTPYFAKRLAAVKHEFKNSKYVTHKVRRGETLNSIARRYEVSLKEVLAVNRIRNARYLKVGQLVMIPTGGSDTYHAPSKRVASKTLKSQVKQTTKNVKSKNLNIVQHTVRRGENIWEISEKYNVPMGQLLNWNNLSKRSVIKPGQKLKVLLTDAR